jgi:hypothetical protein
LSVHLAVCADELPPLGAETLETFLPRGVTGWGPGVTTEVLEARDRLEV